MKGRRGIGGITALIIILVIASTLTVSLGYFSGFLSSPLQTSEYLELSNATIWDLGDNKAIKFLVKNSGNEDARIEYIVFNGDIIPYASKMFGEWIPYNFIESEYLIIPYNSQVEMYIPYQTNEESLEIRLHTLTGNDFTKVLLASSLQTEYEGSPHTNYEQVEIQTGVCTRDAFGNWRIVLSLKNTGNASATLTNVYVNDVEVSAYGVSAPSSAVATITTSLVTATPTIIASGETSTVTVWVGTNYATLSSRTTVNTMIHSAAGNNYIKLIELV